MSRSIYTWAMIHFNTTSALGWWSAFGSSPVVGVWRTNIWCEQGYFWPFSKLVWPCVSVMRCKCECSWLGCYRWGIEFRPPLRMVWVQQRVHISLFRYPDRCLLLIKPISLSTRNEFRSIARLLMCDKLNNLRNGHRGNATQSIRRKESAEQHLVPG